MKRFCFFDFINQLYFLFCFSTLFSFLYQFINFKHLILLAGFNRLLLISLKHKKINMSFQAYLDNIKAKTGLNPIAFVLKADHY